MNFEQQTLLTLLRQSLWGESSSLPAQVDWNAVAVMAKQQGVTSLAYGGAVALKAALPDELRKKWNQVTVMGALRNERLLAAQDEVLRWLEEAEIPAVILKGSSVARYYPQPELRVLGDIDILVPRARLEQVQELLQCNGYRLHESDHDFHIGFDRTGAYVEIHYDVTTLPDSRGGEATREETRRFLENRVCGAVAGHTFPVLGEQHQALMLLLHMVRHMVGGGIGLRQLCDWAMYLASADPVSFLETTVPVLDRCGLLRYAQIASGACMHYLGLPEKFTHWCGAISDSHTRTFMEDIFSGGNMGEADSVKMGRVLAGGDTSGTKQSYVGTLLASLTRLAHHNFPITEKHKWLLPIFWVYLPLRYWVRSLLGLRERKSVLEVAKNAKAKQDFFHMLGLFETEEP